MADRVVLHIGSMKSGTSFIQNVLGNNREALAQHGISFAGERWRDQVDRGPGPHRARRSAPGAARPGGAVAAAGRRDQRDPRHRGGLDGVPRPARHRQDRARPRRLRRVDLQVVLTGRDLARNIAAMWLESVQNGSAVDWDAYLAAVRSEDRSQPVARNFWNHQGLAEIARRWADAVGEDHFTLMTVPPKGAPSSLLWERFAQVLHLDPQAFALDVRANPSIGLATAMTLQHLNALLESRRLHRRQVLRPAGQAPAHQARAGGPPGPGAAPRPRRALGDEARRRGGRRPAQAGPPRGRRPRRAAAPTGPRRPSLAGLHPSSSWRRRWRDCRGWCRSASSARVRHRRRIARLRKASR